MTVIGEKEMSKFLFYYIFLSLSCSLSHTPDPYTLTQMKDYTCKIKSTFTLVCTDKRNRKYLKIEREIEKRKKK